MSVNPRPNGFVHLVDRVRQLAPVLAGLLALSAACADDADTGASTDAGAHDASAAGHKASGGAGGNSGSSGSSGKGGANVKASAGAASDEDTQEVTIRFKAAVADRDFSCLDRYENMGSKHTTVMPADFRFYVQDLKLIAADGTEAPVKLDTRAPWQSKDVALIDFEDAQGHCHGTAETNTSIVGRVPKGEYTGIVFSNGVPEALNHLQQSSQQAPLDVTDLYWAWLSGYRFVVAELAQDAADGGGDAAADDAGLALPGLGLMHVGSTACVKDKGCTKQNRNLIRLPKFDPEKDVIVADLGVIFQDTDLTQDVQCHAADEFCAPMFRQIGVSFESGASLDEQNVYRVVEGGN